MVISYGISVNCRSVKLFQFDDWKCKLDCHFHVHSNYAGHTQKNGAVSKVIKKFISRPTRAQHTLSAVGTAHVSHVLPAVCLSCLLRGRGHSFQDGVAAGEGFLCAPF
jgi:hypothetical protein